MASRRAPLRVFDAGPCLVNCCLHALPEMINTPVNEERLNGISDPDQLTRSFPELLGLLPRLPEELLVLGET